MNKKFVYRITDQDYNNQWVSNYRDAVKKQKQLYSDGSERVQICKEYLS